MMTSPKWIYLLLTGFSAHQCLCVHRARNLFYFFLEQQSAVGIISRSGKPLMCLGGKKITKPKEILHIHFISK